MAHDIMVRLIRVEIAESLRVDIFRQVFHADNIPRVVIEVVINAIGPLFLYRRDLADPRSRQQRLRLGLHRLWLNRITQGSTWLLPRFEPVMIQASGFMLMIFSSETNPEAPGSSCEPILFAPTASTSPPQPL